MRVKRLGFVGVRTDRAPDQVARADRVAETVWADVAFDNPAYAGVGWFFARGPDGNVYVFQQVAD